MRASESRGSLGQAFESSRIGRSEPGDWRGSTRSEGVIEDRPSLVGPNADKVIGFFVGVFAPVLGVLTMAVAMLLWARAGGEDGASRRRRHAESVTMWSGAGTAVILVVVLTILFALVGAAVRNPQLTRAAPPLP